MSKPTPKYNYGFLLTTFNDSDQAIPAFESLKKTIPPGDTWKIIIADGGSSDDHIQAITSNIGCISYTHPDLSSALNGGIYRMLGYEPDGSNIGEFVKTGIADVDYVIWIHTDMKFLDYDWANKLCYCYEKCWPMFGKLAPGTSNIDGSHPTKEVLRHGNNCPWVMSAEFLREFISVDGYAFDPKFIRCGASEDFDFNARILNMGYGFAICSLVDIWHKGMGTREKSDTVQDQIHNREVYEKKHGYYKEPGGTVDLKEIGEDLQKDFEETFEDRWYDKPKGN